MAIFFPAVALLALAPLAYVRLAPSDPALWHVDPMSVPRPPDQPAEGGWLIRDGSANAAPRVFATDPTALLAAFDAVATADPTTRLLAGSPDEGLVTYISRTKLMGFPDYTSVGAVEKDGGAALMIWGRNRFGVQDLGVNKMRIEAWLSQLDDRLAAG